jgi:hypothetical protein
MTIERVIDPNDGWDDQVGLRLRCTADEAQSIHSALRLLFRGRMSPVFPGRRGGYPFTILITASQQDLERRWDEVLRLAGLSGSISLPVNVRVPGAAIQPPAHASAPTIDQPTPAPTSRPIRGAAGLASLRDPWEQRFRAAVKAVLDSESSPVTQTAALTVSPGGVAGEVDDDALLDALPPSSRLRALITRYAHRGQHEQIVALCAQRPQDVLALPTSQLLVSQLLDAHLIEAERHKNEALAIAGRELALAFLPELERLRQSSAIRARLRRTDEGASASEADIAQAPLAERLDVLMRVEPADRLRQLDDLRSRYPKATAVRLALADAHAALGHIEQALALYQAERSVAEASERAAELLLASGRAREALSESEGLDLSPRMAGLRGAALAALSDMGQARPLLEQAWREGERSPSIAVAYARVLATAGDLEGAAEPYLIALEVMPASLRADDYRVMADIALGAGYGDLTGEEQAQYLDRYIERAGRGLRERPDAERTLQMRVELRRSAEHPERLRESLADWLEYLAEIGELSSLDKATRLLRDLRREGAITRLEQYDLLEAIEHFAADVPDLSDVLALEYQTIALDELNLSLRQGQPIPAYISDVRRALHFLSKDLADEVAQRIEMRRQELTERNLSAPDQVVETAAISSLAGIRLTLVGGHVATRREVERELREQYDLSDYIEIAPSSDDHVDKAKVRERVIDRDLVVVITGYIGHDLTNIIRDLQRSQDLTGQVIWPKCRGKSGVVREVIESQSNIP